MYWCFRGFLFDTFFKNKLEQNPKLAAQEKSFKPWKTCSYLISGFRLPTSGSNQWLQHLMYVHGPKSITRVPTHMCKGMKKNRYITIYGLSHVPYWHDIDIEHLITDRRRTKREGITKMDIGDKSFRRLLKNYLNGGCFQCRDLYFLLWVRQNKKRISILCEHPLLNKNAKILHLLPYLSCSAGRLDQTIMKIKVRIIQEPGFIQDFAWN